MRIVLALILAVATGFAAAWLWLGSGSGGASAGDSSTAQTGESTERGIRFTPSGTRETAPEARVVTRTLYVSGTNKLGAREVLGVLLKLHPSAGDETRNRVFRQIIYYTQMLAEMGAESVPVIQEFLKKNQDVDYSGDLLNASGERVGRHAGAPFASRNITRTDFIVPPSLRLGLVDVLAQIGSPEAIAVLVEILDTSGRGVEVAYVARVLQDEAPDQYRENALKAARDLLANPPAIDQPNRLDENARAYLYSVLAMYNDTSFADVAKTILVTPEGKVDRQAMTYLSDTLKDQSVTALYDAYKSARVTNQIERTHLLNGMLGYTGPSAQANEIFKEIVSDESVPAGIRAYAIQNLAGTGGADKLSDPQLIESRLQFLRTLRDSFKDERILRSIDDTRAALERLKTGVIQ